MLTRCVDVLVEFLDGDGQRWQKNTSTGKLKLLNISDGWNDGWNRAH